MKIAIASSGLGHISRGIETWADDLARALVSRGLSAILCKGGGICKADFERVVPCMQRGAVSTKQLLGCLPRRFFWRFGLANGYGVEQTSFAAGLIRILRREQIDILHVQDPILALLVQRARQMKLVQTRTILGHGTEEPLSFIRKIDYLQHLAPWHLEEAKRGGIWKSTWTAIPNFIDSDRFNPNGPNLRAEFGIPADAIVMLTVAAIKRVHKRIDYILGEFSRLRDQRPDLPVWLVIAGGWEQETDELVAFGRAQFGERVRFLVRFPRDRMPDLYRTANIFTLGSLMEMMPIALLEATASGLPCIVNRHPVMEWMIGPGGKSIDMTMPGALAAVLADLSANLEMRIKLGSLARDHCGEHFGRDRVVDKIIGYYDFVMAHDQEIAARAVPEMRE